MDALATKLRQNGAADLQQTFTRQTQYRRALFFGRRDPVHWLRAAWLPGICRFFCRAACQRRGKGGRRTRFMGAFFRITRAHAGVRRPILSNFKRRSPARDVPAHLCCAGAEERRNGKNNAAGLLSCGFWRLFGHGRKIAQTPWNDWYHVVSHVYGSWLRGDPRGWRSVNHREHVEGIIATRRRPELMIICMVYLNR